MKKNIALSRLLVGLLLTALAYFVSMFVGHQWHLNSSILADSVIGHATMLVLSVVLISVFKKQVNYRIVMPRFKQVLRPIALGFLCAVVINVVLSIITKIISGSVQNHPLMEDTTLLKTFLSVFTLASIGEELLFRGFLQNYLRVLGDKGLTLFKRRISLPVLIGALTFSLAHLILLASGAGTLFIVRILVFTFVLGLIAGYYQEKHDNNAFAILVHMAGNLMGLISVAIM